MSVHTLSTTAWRTYWLGRHLERAGNTARLVLVNANLLIDLPVRLPLGWLPLVEILALESVFEELYPDHETDSDSESRTDEQERKNDEKVVTRFLLSDTRHESSVTSSLRLARENARSLRGVLPRDAFEHINQAYLYATEAFQEPLSRTRRANGLQHTVERLQQIDGFLSSTMLHSDAWQFIRLGNFLERADMVTRIIDLPTTGLLRNHSELQPFHDTQWRSVLRSLDAMQGYTVTMQSPVNQPDVLEFLIKDPNLPRSLLRCLGAIRRGLRLLPKNSVPLAQISAMNRQIQRARVRSLSGPRLHRFVDARQKQLATLHQKITNTYFPEID